MKILTVVGARPNLMKAAPLLKEFNNYSEIDSILVHTGQHYDYNMNDVFFKDFDMLEPDYNIRVGSGLHGWQTGTIMIEFEKICLTEKPDLVIVLGDVNSTVACSLVAKKLLIAVAHIEAGLRYYDKTMPEEINRVLTDHCSDYLFVTEQSGVDCLIKENFSKKQIYFVGDLMIDCIHMLIDKIKNVNECDKLSLQKNNFVITTLHRVSNVDNKEILADILDALDLIQKEIPILFALHPRTKNNLEKFNLFNKLTNMTNVIITEPLNYFSLMSLINDCRFVLSDSGGIQSEALYLKKPMITIRDRTEKLATIEAGGNFLSDNKKNNIVELAQRFIKDNVISIEMPQYWDGQTAKRITDILIKELR